MTKYIATEIDIPIQSNKRDPRAAIIPPFSFVGELEIGTSGYWYPTSTMYLNRVSLSASGAGTSTATLSLLVNEPGNDTPIPIIESMTLGATDTKKVYWLQDVLVTPRDKIYVASWAESAHTGVVIQIVGVLMS